MNDVGFWILREAVDSCECFLGVWFGRVEVVLGWRGKGERGGEGCVASFGFRCHQVTVQRFSISIFSLFQILFKIPKE